MTTDGTSLVYASSHEWARVLDGNIIEVGISNYAQESLGDVVYVELPQVGQKVDAGQQCCAIESVKAASDIYAPVSGEVVAVNDSLDGEPELLNDSPYSDGWMFRINASDISELDGMLSEQAYLAEIED